MQETVYRHPSSYRDPSGYLFYSQGKLYRQVNKVYAKDFDHFIESGLYNNLSGKGRMISHSEVNENITGSEDWYKTLEPELLPFISYPYEWSFDMWKDAALTTLDLAREGLKYNMILKDGSAYNVQLHKGRMTFIDTLSFEQYDEQKPWIAYRQFCQHFLAPLALMHYLQQPMQAVFLAYPDGLPLPLVSKILPFKSKLNLHTYLHLHLQGKPSKNVGNQPITNFIRKKLENILDSLRSAVSGYKYDQPSGVWSGYYEEAAEREDYLEQKKEIINTWLDQLSIRTAIDLGANEGTFSEMVAGKGVYTIATDFDHFSINRLYNRVKEKAIANLHPLILDLANPSPAIGVNNTERVSFLDRADGDLVLALALIHHLSIGRNIPFKDIAALFKSAGRILIVEYVPKEDEKVQLMLQHKKDIYNWYTKEHFEKEFSSSYTIADKKPVGNSGRTLYLMHPL